MGMKVIDWNIQALTGYEPKTTFYTDFSIADRFGLSGIKDTFKRAFKSWKNDYVYLTELCMVLNWKLWEHYEYGDSYHQQIAKLYESLWNEVQEYCENHLKGDELDYFLATTD